MDLTVRKQRHEQTPKHSALRIMLFFFTEGWKEKNGKNKQSFDEC